MTSSLTFTVLSCGGVKILCITSYLQEFLSTDWLKRKLSKTPLLMLSLIRLVSGSSITLFDKVQVGLKDGVFLSPDFFEM